MSLYFNMAIPWDVMGQYQGLVDPTDMGPYHTLMWQYPGMSWDSTKDLLTPRTWDHAMPLYFNVAIPWDVLGQYRGLELVPYSYTYPFTCT